MEGREYKISTELLQSITTEQAWHYRIIPKSVNGVSMEFYSDNTDSNGEKVEELELLFGKKITLYDLEKDELQKRLSSNYKSSNKSATSQKNIFLDESNFLEYVLSEASSLNSSDIHFEAFEDHARVRLRVDGKLFERFLIKSSKYAGLINKIKILARLDIAEKRLPQDGRIKFQGQSESFDIRVSILPSIYGEKAVLRLLSKSAVDLSIESLGMSSKQLSDFTVGIQKTQGIVLISGPTGSGKTTTLYATLNRLNSDQVNILTIEDPIEYTIDGINQVQLKENIGLTFARSLKTFLRQDPDIIMLGEIRDPETAQMAIRASLTGHLVLSTIHTNSALGIITRLLDMGIPGYLLASTLNTVVAQRLVRILCSNCKEEDKLVKLSDNTENISKANTIVYKPKGCPKCNHTGYKGRTALFEVLPITPKIRSLIRSENIDEQKIYKDMKTDNLEDSAKRLYLSGKTSFEEIASMLNDN